MEAGGGEVRHWNAEINGISIHVAELGPATGPAVLLLHGFPELWLSWRHQMAALAARGFRALAPDLRGYGDSAAAAGDADEYSILHLAGDAVGLLDHLGVAGAFVVGHDWGALVAWHLCLFGPDRVRAVVALAVPYLPRGHRSLMETFAARGDGFYIVQFQEPGRAEKAFGRYDVATVLNKFFSIESEDFTAPPGVEIIDFLEAPASPPSWMTKEELAQYAEKFQKSGFTGPLNYYRMFDMNWRLTAPWNGAKITVPAKFIVGDKDIGFKSGTEDYIKSEDFRSSVPGVEVAIIDGHHFIQQEQPERVNAEILSFLEKFTSKEA
ncbi:hypothetical protein HU200_040763 [Digitaria exilis]|uniref:soluble epoxide hydrolase n=1 Tax=Digitaria exilis TaxID=1010633 RepID=A0A835B6J4_9POAL|nr:hypothetical protein HU200_040763 [Digitaria exilis]